MSYSRNDVVRAFNAAFPGGVQNQALVALLSYLESGDVEPQEAPAALTASTGTAGDTISDAGSSFNQTTLNNNFKSLAAKINTIIDALKDAGVLT